MNLDLEFVKAWQTSGSVSEVAKKLNIPTKKAQHMALRMRKYGVPLKKMSRKGLRKVDHYDLLKKAAQELAPEENLAEVI